VTLVTLFFYTLYINSIYYIRVLKTSQKRHKCHKRFLERNDGVEDEESECTRCSKDPSQDGKQDCRHCTRVSAESIAEIIELYDQEN